MKNSKRGKRCKKFVDFDGKEFNKSKNNNTIGNIIFSHDPKNEKTIQPATDYQTPVQSLLNTFPNMSLDVIEAIYEEKDRNYFITKKVLEDMTNEVKSKDESLSNSNSFSLSTDIEKRNDFDINALIRFKSEDEDPFIDENINAVQANSTKNLEEIKNKKCGLPNKVSTTIIANQKKSGDDYESVFTATPTPEAPYDQQNYIDEMILDDYVEVLHEIFPNITRTDITIKICEYDFDIDKVVLFFFDESDQCTNEEFSQLEVTEISNKEEVLSNFFSYDITNPCIGNKIDIDALCEHNLQGKIEKEIKKSNILSKFTSVFNEEEFPYLSEEVRDDVMKSNQISDEYFLDKEIKTIKNKQIKEDLTKLTKCFPIVSEFDIKWVYYQFMDYYETYNYFKSKCNGGNYEKKIIFSEHKTTEKLPQMDKKFSISSDNNTNPSICCGINSHAIDMISTILSENPKNWKIESSIKNININDYQSIRKKLIWQAQLAWRSGRHQDAKVIMAKARRYKQEINHLLESKKIAVFMKNNQQLSLENLFSKSENSIDIHGLSFEEAKTIINKKISNIKRKRDLGLLDNSKRFTLNIIAGIGTHSKNNIPVLLPKIFNMLKIQLKFRTKVDEQYGIIKVFI